MDEQKNQDCDIKGHSAQNREDCYKWKLIIIRNETFREEYMPLYD